MNKFFHFALWGVHLLGLTLIVSCDQDTVQSNENEPTTPNPRRTATPDNAENENTADPTQLLQRTGNACINEGGFPPNSFDSENINIFYDYSCTADSGGAAGCHRTQLPTLSCVQALNAAVDAVETAVRFQRQEWDEALADEVRLGEIVSADAPDLRVVSEDIQNYRIIYRYFAPNSCAIAEACVNGSGWRRLLQFDANVHNLGAAPLDAGSIVAENPLTNMFEYNSCHAHFHFQNYGEFQLGETGQPSKQAFCVESTSRFSNNELSPLTHPYSCTNQVLRACETSSVLGVGTACAFEDAVLNQIIRGETAEISFTCPFVRDENEPGGDCALYAAPLFSGDEFAEVSCTAVTPEAAP